MSFFGDSYKFKNHFKKVLSNKHECLFLHLYINLILKNIPQFINLILKNIPQFMNLRDICFPQYLPNCHKNVN